MKRTLTPEQTAKRDERHILVGISTKTAQWLGMETITEKPHWLDGSTAGFVSKSFDADWPKWAVCYPGRSTRWFDTKEKAESVLADIRKSVTGYGVPA